MTEQSHPLKELLRDPVEPARTQAVWRRIATRHRPARRSTIALALAGAAAALLLFAVGRQVGFTWPAAARHPPAGDLRLRLVDGKALPSVVESGETGVRLALSDASAIELAPGSELRVQQSTASVFATALVRGRARFQVAPHGPRSWSIRAGEVEVRVVGTRFVVERSANDVRVTVEHGVVRVLSPSLPAGERQLTAGESLRVAAEGAASDSATPSASPEPADGGSPDAMSARAATPGPPGRSYAADDLFAMADRLRLSGDLKRAARTLARLVDEHPDDPRAALAALTLGRIYIQLEKPTQAVRALERAEQLRLPPGLGEEAAAWLVLAYANAGREEQARIAAARYHAKFPHGQRGASVDAWLGAH